MIRVKKVIGNTDIKYKICTAGSKFTVPAGRQLTVIYNSKSYTAKVHNSAKGRLDGLSAFYKENDISLGDELELCYDEDSNIVYIIKTNGEMDNPFESVLSKTDEWTSIEGKGIKDFEPMDIPETRICHLSYDPGASRAAANSNYIVLMGKTELTVFDKQQERFKKVAFRLEKEEIYPSDFTGCALAEDNTLYWTYRGNQAYYCKTNIHTGETEIISKYKCTKDAFHYFEGVYYFSDQNIFAVLRKEDSDTVKYIEQAGFSTRIAKKKQGPIVGIAEGILLIIRGDDGYACYNSPSAIDSCEMGKPLFETFVLDKIPQLEKDRGKLEKARREFEKNFYAYNFDPVNGEHFVAVRDIESLSDAKYDPDSIIIFKTLGTIEKRKCSRTQIDYATQSSAYSNIYGYELGVDRGYNLCIRYPDGRIKTISRTEGMGTECTFRMVDSVHAVIKTNEGEHTIFDLKKGKAYKFQID